jgi:Xaa-Pro dipeptidase
MVRDSERVARIQRALHAHALDALVCTLPSNVRLASGYWPVIGNAIAIVTREGVVALLAPSDEEELAADGWADVVKTFPSGSLDAVESVMEAVTPHLRDLAVAAGIRGRARIGFEGASFDPSVYAAGFAYGGSLPGFLSSTLSNAELVDATDVFATLRSTLTPDELVAIREACGIAKIAFERTAGDIRAGVREYEIADVLRSHLRARHHSRADGFAYCMSGPNTARAHRSFQESTARSVVNGDLVLLHCNSCCGGLWTDITRTFSLGPACREIRVRLEAILAARRSAIDAIGDGVPASQVDRAARSTLREAGFESEFKHPTGHGVGFAAINHNALPRLHPRSEDVLEAGMVCNVEPAVYAPGAFGARHCDMVVVGRDGAELLTGFQQTLDDLQLTVH